MLVSDDEFKPMRPGEATDLSLVPGELRAFRSEVRDALEGIARALQSLGRIEERIDVVIDRQNATDARVLAVEQRLTVLESKKRRTPAKRK